MRCRWQRYTDDLLPPVLMCKGYANAVLNDAFLRLWLGAAAAATALQGGMDGGRGASAGKATINSRSER